MHLPAAARAESRIVTLEWEYKYTLHPSLIKRSIVPTFHFRRSASCFINIFVCVVLLLPRFSKCRTCVRLHISSNLDSLLLFPPYNSSQLHRFLWTHITCISIGPINSNRASIDDINSCASFIMHSSIFVLAAALASVMATVCTSLRLIPFRSN
jgi:hypothetical protein